MKIEAMTGPLAAVFGALAITACASTPMPPSASFQAADIAIANADKEKASEFAPVEVKSAHDKIAAARATIAQDPDEADMIRARRLADEAQADAELASARARQARAAAINTELQKNNDTLREELQRSGGAS